MASNKTNQADDGDLVSYHVGTSYHTTYAGLSLKFAIYLHV